MILGSIEVFSKLKVSETLRTAKSEHIPSPSSVLLVWVTSIREAHVYVTRWGAAFRAVGGIGSLSECAATACFAFLPVLLDTGSRRRNVKLEITNRAADSV